MSNITELLCLLDFHRYKVTNVEKGSSDYNNKWDIYEECKWCGTEKDSWTKNKAMVAMLKREINQRNKRGK